ncbi:MAG: NADH-quinone oxidoreductase subunit J [Candidatus Binatia bacterium]|nr:NADH-quinone oxidoreductase subunit J [Candidatus Binatia bacterium]
MELFLFKLFSIVAIGSGLLAVTRRNPMQCAIFLILSLLGVAGLYSLLQASFIAVIQILIYAGAVMVLMLFVIMMLNLRDEDMLWERRGLLSVVGASLALFVLYQFWKVLGKVDFPTAVEVGKEFGAIGELGRLLFSEYLLIFELISVLLLVAVIGAVILSRGASRDKT